ncbi:MAG: leucine-rich repeat domain-containing protein [Spirulina sp. SIO3F2]|nr:leucine-rich repeat domain-containing protein [Spirulina sp. SIO3F2]
MLKTSLLSIFVTLATVPPALAQSNSLNTFADWCNNQNNLAPGARHTVEIILQRVDIQDCDRAQQALAATSSLRLSDSELTDLAPLASLTHLTDLTLSYNQITDLTPLANLTRLKELNLDENNVVDITPLAGLTQLQDLDLDHNDVKDITILAGLTNLDTLWLYGNQIEDISPLTGLTKLTWLELGDNPLPSEYCPVSPARICNF